MDLCGRLSGEDTLLPLTTGSSLAIQFSSYGDLPAVIHIGRIVPRGDIRLTQQRTINIGVFVGSMPSSKLGTRKS